MHPREWRSEEPISSKQPIIWLALTISLIMIGVMAFFMIQKANENERLQSRVNELNQQLNTQQLTFEKDRRDIERQLAELRSIEEQ